jgi:lantibiotic transport system permease protein
MINTFIRSFQSEWMKTRRSLATWIIVIGAFFTPTIFTIARLVKSENLSEKYASGQTWIMGWNDAWQSMAFFLLPLGVILVTSLITQIEFKNNTWKQLHTLPLSYTTIFFSKLTVILVMLFMFFALFNIGTYFSIMIPQWLIKDVPYPSEGFPFMRILKSNVKFFIDCLPIVGLQYLISLRFKNFLVPVGIGFMLLIGCLIAIQWEYSYALPYSYTIQNHFRSSELGISFPGPNIHIMAIIYFIVFTVAGYALYITKKEKG